MVALSAELTFTLLETANRPIGQFNHWLYCEIVAKTTVFDCLWVNTGQLVEPKCCSWQEPDPSQESHQGTHQRFELQVFCRSELPKHGHHWETCTSR